MAEGKIKPPSRLSRIRKILEEAGKPLSVQDITRRLGLPGNKIRQSIGGSYELKVMRVADNLYDLPERVYAGKNFRYTPSWEEITQDLIGSGDLAELLTVGRKAGKSAVVADESGIEHPLKIKRVLPRSFSLDFNLSGLKRWYKKAGFKFGDDIVFTCQDFSPPRYAIARLPKEYRDEANIAQKNRQLADLVFRQILAGMRKFIHPMFLIPKYVFLFPFSDPVPPDSLFKALKNDERFLITRKLMNGIGEPMNEWTVGIKKYFFHNTDDLWVEVFIDKDEFGRFGACANCGERLLWDKQQGWRHLKDDIERAFTYLTPEFFKLGKED